MKVVNTRLNPTLNGNMHLGHIFMAKLNEHAAHSRDGRFTVRFDDNQEMWCDELMPEVREEIKAGMIEDFAWLGIKVDGYSSQATSSTYVHNMISKFNNGPLGVRTNYMSQINPEVIDCDSPDFPYAPKFTAEKVILDMRDRITLLIRGKDLIGEFSLYCYFCELWDLSMPHHVYVPRLQNGSEEISKTRGGMTVKGFREAGWSAKDLIDKLASSCLNNPKGDWSYLNVKKEPIWRA